jgi:hypothetical protein
LLVVDDFGLLRDHWWAAANCWGHTTDEVGEAGGRDLNQIVARTGYASP